MREDWCLVIKTSDWNCVIGWVARVALWSDRFGKATIAACFWDLWSSRCSVVPKCQTTCLQLANNLYLCCSRAPLNCNYTSVTRFRQYLGIHPVGGAPASWASDCRGAFGRSKRCSRAHRLKRSNEYESAADLNYNTRHWSRLQLGKWKPDRASSHLRTRCI